MKTTISSRLAIVIIVAGIGFFYACTKSSSSNSSTSSTSSPADLQASSDDQSQVSYESDAVMDDANTSLSGQMAISGASADQTDRSGRITTLGIKQEDTAGVAFDSVYTNLICDASVAVSDTGGTRAITITYNGTNCSGTRTRTGTVVISIPKGVYWKDAGAAVTVSIQNLTITRLRDNKVIIINGTKTYTNVSGGLIVDLPNLGSIVHTVSGSMTITFPNASERQWNVAKQRTFTYSDGVVVTTTGTHTDSLNNTDVAEWGVDRFGTSFEALISQPKVIAQSCDFRLTGGQDELLRSDNVTLTLTYGLDASGNATTCPGTGTYYFKAVIVGPKGLSYTYILPY
jgi:hypothetical protein